MGRFATVAAASLLALPLATAAEPESQGPPDALAEPVGQLAEVIVTAEKRPSPVQSTPISITALTQAELGDAGVMSAQGIAQLTPGLAVVTAGPGQAQYEIRGISANGGESPTVGFYLDGIPVTPPASATTGKNAIDPDLYDLQQVEVLRGPQGTLYGAGSLGGTVKIETHPASVSGVKGSAQTMVSVNPDGRPGYGERAMINLPLLPDTALRLDSAYTHTAGWIDRVVVPNFPLESNPSPTLFGTQRGMVQGVPGSLVHKDVNDEDVLGTRARMFIAPTENLSIEPEIFYQRVSQGGINAYDSSPGTLAHYQPFDIAEPYSDTFTLYGLNVHYAFPVFDLTSTSGYWTRRTSQNEDGTEQIQDNFMLPSYYTDEGLGIGPVLASEIDNTRQFSEEFRAASIGDTRFQWLVGMFYSDYHYLLRSGSTVPGLLTLAGSPFATDLLFAARSPLTISQTAAFAHLSYQVSRHVKLTLGARRFAFHSNVIVATSGAVYTGSDAANVASARASATGTSPLANVSYTPDSRTMYYATAAKGFREGGGNLPIPTTGVVGSQCLLDLESFGRTSSPLVYRPDTVWNYEAGRKASYFDRRLIVNADGYYMKWSDVQEPVALSCGLGYTDNATQAAVKGGELELQAALPLRLTLTQNVGYTHATFTQNSLEAGIVNGESLLNVPHWTVSTLLEYEQPMTAGLTLTAAVSNSYVSSQQDLSDVIHRLPGRDLVGLRVGLARDRWNVQLYADNVLNRQYPEEYMNLMTFTGPPYERIATNSPRTVGFLFNVEF